MIELLIYLVVLLLIIGLVWWLIDYIPLPEPINKVAKVVVVVIGVIAVVYVLLGVSGTDLRLQR